jgi:hypothetical protein
MGRSRTTRAGRALTEKQNRFVRLIAQGVSNREACRIVGSIAGPGHAGDSGERSETRRARRCTIRPCTS